MTENEVVQLVQKVITDNALRNLYQASPIPFHTHNNTDSPGIDPANLTNASSYFALNEVVLSTADILALNTTPITIVPLPSYTSGTSAASLNSIIVVEGITAKIYTGNIGYAGANNLEFRYTNGSGTKVTADMTNTFINTAAGSQAYMHVAGITTAFTPAVNAAVVAYVPVANPTGGNGSIRLIVKYRVISL